MEAAEDAEDAEDAEIARPIEGPTWTCRPLPPGDSGAQGLWVRELCELRDSGNLVLVPSCFR